MSADLPRSGSHEPDGYLIVAAIMLLVAPAALPVWAWTAWARRRVERWLLPAVTVVFVVIAFLFRGELGGIYRGLGGGLAAGVAEHGLAPSWGLLGAAAATFGRSVILTLPVGIPLGLAAGQLTARAAPVAPVPVTVARPTPPKVERSAFLAVAVESKPPGDLPASWYHGKYLAMPAREAGQSRIIVGRPGSGKSELIYRELYLAGRTGQRSVTVDCKGEEAFARDVVGAYLQGWGDGGQPGQPTLHLWPSQPLSCWTGGPVPVANRLLSVWSWNPRNEWYREVVSKALQLALTAPGPEVTSSVELVQRLRPGVLEDLWEGHQEQTADLRSISKDNRLDDVSLRVSNLMGALGHHLDGDPAKPLGTADLTVVSLPVMAAENDANSILRVMLSDLAFFVVGRKASGERVLVVVDEMSAVEGGRRHVVHVAERGRSAGVACVMAVQSDAGLGDDQDVNRLLGAVNTVALLNTAEPERLIRLAGSRRQAEETSSSVGDDGITRHTTSRVWVDQVDPNVVRALPVGHAFLMSRGRAQLAKIIQAPKATDDVAADLLALPRP